MSSEPAARKLILLPGMDGTAALFDQLIACLPASFEAIPIAYQTDQPLTYPELSELVRSRLPDLEPFVLMAESFSTPVAIQIAGKQPSGLKALIIVAGFATNPASDWASRIAALLLPLLGRIRFPRFLIQRYLLGPNASQLLVDAVKRAVSSLRPEVVVSRLMSILHCDVRTELAQVDIPILYLQASRDRVVLPRCLDGILAIKPDTTVVRIDGPHLLLQREPRQSAEAVAQFLGKLQGSDLLN